MINIKYIVTNGNILSAKQRDFSVTVSRKCLFFSFFWETAKLRTESSELRAAWKIPQICSYFIQVYSQMWVCSYTEDLRTIKTVCPGWKPDGFQSELDISAPNSLSSGVTPYVYVAGEQILLFFFSTETLLSFRLCHRAPLPHPPREKGFQLLWIS